MRISPEREMRAINTSPAPLAGFFLDCFLCFRRSAAASLFDSGLLEFFFVGAERAIDLDVILGDANRIGTLVGILAGAHFFRRRPSAAKRPRGSALPASGFGVHLVLAIDAILRERYRVKPRQRDFVAASRTGSIIAGAEPRDRRVDRAEPLLRALEQRGVSLDFGERSRDVHLIGWRWHPSARLFAHQFLHSRERVSALFGKQLLERIDSPAASSAHC